MFWRLHKAIFGTRIEEVISILEGLNDSYQIVEGKPSQLAEVPFTTTNQASLAITTLQDAQRLIRKDYPSTPWLFFNNSHYKVSYWLPRIDPSIAVLNKEALFLPSGLLGSKQVGNIVQSGDKIFIKPDSGNKSFTGFSVVNDQLLHTNIKDQLMFSHIEPEEMCVLSPHIDLEDIEWRFWISENKIIAYTPYAWESEPLFYEPPTQVMQMAEKMAQNSWQPDYCYVADFCTTKQGQVMLIEINAASTSGIYNVQMNKLIPLIRLICEKEWSGNLD